MNSLEALTRLIAHVDGNMKHSRELITNPSFAETTTDPEWLKNVEDTEVAIAICQAILNTALPIARFRAHVQITPVDLGKGASRELTICSPDIAGIQAGLMGTKIYTGNVFATLWEQKQGGADMLSGHQGYCKGQLFAKWIKSLTEFSEERVVN